MKKIKHFTLAEFLNSTTARRLNIDNIPPFDVVDNLKRLAYYLDGVREKLDKPITVTSGYRCPRLNNIVGGVPTSQHQKGLAADLVCSDMDKLEKVLRETGGFDQLIKEHYQGSKHFWYHVSVAPCNSKPRNQILNLEKK